MKNLFRTASDTAFESQQVRGSGGWCVATVKVLQR
jgi:hypothetical protein